MWSSSGRLTLLLTAALTIEAHAQFKGSACPARQQTRSLSAADVFDGPPSEMADLVPDVSRGTSRNAFASWDVASTFSAGRHIFLVCKYGSAKRQVVVEVENKVNRCIYRSHPGKRLELSCK